MATALFFDTYCPVATSTASLTALSFVFAGWLDLAAGAGAKALAARLPETIAR